MIFNARYLKVINIQALVLNICRLCSLQRQSYVQNSNESELVLSTSALFWIPSLERHIHSTMSLLGVSSRSPESNIPRFTTNEQSTTYRLRHGIM